MFQLNEKSPRTMYEQVMDNIKELIMTDVLKENEKLPSVRDLSRRLTLNPNTVQKAFKELEREGYIFTVSGKGTFVRNKNDVVRDPEKVNEILAGIGTSYKSLLFLGYTEDEAKGLIEKELSGIGAQGRSAADAEVPGTSQEGKDGKENII